MANTYGDPLCLLYPGHEDPEGSYAYWLRSPASKQQSQNTHRGICSRVCALHRCTLPPAPRPPWSH